MVSESLVWLILFAPLASFLVIAFVIWPACRIRAARSRSPDSSDHEAHGHASPRDGVGASAGLLTIAAVGVSFVISLATLASVISEHGPIEYPLHEWLTVGGFTLNVGILMDPLTAIMLVVVTGVSLMVQIYSTGYMSEEDNPGYAPILRLYVPVHRLDGRLGAGVRHHPDIRVLGNWSGCVHTCS